MMKVLIAEDQTLVRQGIVALLSELSSDIVEAANGEHAYQQLIGNEFDLVLLDIGLPIRTGLDLLQSIRKAENSAKVIVLTGDVNNYSPRQIYAAGADAFLYKTADASHFIETCYAVLRGEKMQANEHLNNVAAREPAQLRDTLTLREQQIVKLIVEGMSNKTAADSLFISEHTVRKHREHINEKLAIRSPLALAKFAIKTGLV